jgi:hypothetical protein
MATPRKRKPPRKRDYKKEYARRKELERERAKAEKREFSLKRARGHRSDKWERMERKVREMEATKAPWEQFNTKDVYRIAEQEGPDVVFEALELRRRASEAYEVGNLDVAHDIWLARNPDLPEWLYHYHGFFT